MGLFFGRKKHKKDQLRDLADLEPLDLTNQIFDEPTPEILSRKEKRKLAKAEKKEKKVSSKSKALVQEEITLAPEMIAESGQDQQPIPERPIIPPIKVKSTGDPTRDAMAQKFAELRRVVAQKKSDEEFDSQMTRHVPHAELRDQDTLGSDQNSEELEDAAIGFDLQQRDELDGEIAPVQTMVTSEDYPHDSTRVQLTDAWLGLWVSEQGRSLYIEEVEIGEYQVTALPDPMSKCYSGPDFPEIETWRMPAHFVREEIGEVIGDRLKVNTVPGLPEGHQAPFVNMYFLTSAEDGEADETRFAEDADPLKSIFLVCDSDGGTVNPWGIDDEIVWLGESLSFYKAPEKLDQYLASRMAKDDPSNRHE